MTTQSLLSSFYYLSPSPHLSHFQNAGPVHVSINFDQKVLDLKVESTININVFKLHCINTSRIVIRFWETTHLPIPYANILLLP